MKQWILKILVRWVLSLILHQTPVTRVLDWVKEAESTMDNRMSKKGFVYRKIEASELEHFSFLMGNAATELSVYLYKQIMGSPGATPPPKKEV